MRALAMLINGSTNAGDHPKINSSNTVQGGDLLAWIQQDIQIATVTVDTFSLSRLGPTIASKAGAR